MNRNFYKRKNIINAKPKPPVLVGISDDYKADVCSQSYLGKKGYTIPKSALTKEEEEFLKKDLYVKPIVFGAIGTAEAASFPVYRENANKIYIPRFYGIHRYGMPNCSEIDFGENIDVEFIKPLRDYQNEIIKVYTDYVNTPICIDADINGGGGILEVPCGLGKCLGKDTSILMYDGSIKLVQDVKVGDKLMGDDSTPRNVLTLARGKEMMYKVSSKKGDGYIVNQSHILSLKYSTTVNKNTPKGTVLDISVTDYLNLPKTSSEILLGYRAPITFSEKPVEIDPYLLGYWLCDGSYDKIHTIMEIFKEFLINNNLINKKHIPMDYKCNSRQVQLKLIAGIIDSESCGCGHIDGYEIVQKNEVLSDDIVYLARSLGFEAYKKKIQKADETCSYYSVNICGVGLEDIPVKCLPKKNYIGQRTQDGLNYRINLEPLEKDDYYGFEIDGNHRFVLGDFTVTHNTVMSLKIISLLKKKTLIIVHKEFLMNQWIERISEFLPSAKVGKIQGTLFDVAGKDIVIGMLQSLYDRDFPADSFSVFGLTIIDEVHRIGSEQFSKTLTRIITPYMLGISATVDRKDKLTKVLHMFIGDKIYSKKREDEDLVCVRALTYISNDSEFNETETDFRGKPKYSTMITKLCSFNSRSDFIVRVIGGLLKESDNQIMILCHNRSLLTYLYEAIQYRNLATVGYYVGGMKQVKLQETELKQIVLATYAMAAEALDIKSLATLVMVTPKTDITQSVGRILRIKHENPIIVDIVDSHDLFQNQWTQRKRFYKKCNYRIIQTNSLKYKNMDDIQGDEWIKVFEPKNSKNEKTINYDSDTSKEMDSNERECLIHIEGLEGIDD